MSEIPAAAIWRGPPTRERILQIRRDYPVMPDGWIYRRQPDGSLKRWHRHDPWPGHGAPAPTAREESVP